MSYTPCGRRLARKADGPGRPAVRLMEALPPVEGRPYVFPGRDFAGPRASVTRLWRAVRHEAGLAGVRLHDVPHSFASAAASAGTSLQPIGAALGHRRLETTRRYAPNGRGDGGGCGPHGGADRGADGAGPAARAVSVSRQLVLAQ